MTRLKSVSQRGFTLIELMIVVAIIGILAAVAIPKFAEMIRKSKEGASKGSLSAMRSALTIYLSDNEGMQPLSRTPGFDHTSAGDVATKASLFEGPFVPKYIEAIPTVKLGTYHSDSRGIRVSRTPVSGSFDGNRSSGTVDGLDVAGGAVASLWNYTSNGDAALWVNCSHSDTKAEPVSGW